MPVHRSILVVDIEGSTGPLRTNPIKQELRRTVYELLAQAFAAAGIDGSLCRFTDRGDGVLILVPPDDRVPKTLLLHPLVPELDRLLTEYDRALPEPERAMRGLRLRLAIHAGEVHIDPRGPFGEEIDVACRLVDSRAVKDALRTSGGPLVVVISDEIFFSIVKHRYEGICSDAFARTVRVTCGGRSRRGRIRTAPPALVLAPLLRLGAA
ncbi:hypothetical protein [Actinocorallia lasiicapitis]